MRKIGVTLLLAGSLFVVCLPALQGLVESWRITVPYLYADEWPVVERVSAATWSDALRVGHNGVPSYYQNAVWWLDYHRFGQRGVFPRCFQDGLMALGLLVFARLVRWCGLSRCDTAWFMSLVVSLWYTGANSAQFFHYVWGGFEKSLAFLLLAASSTFLLGLIQSPQPRKGSLFATLATAWAALYMHGGFALLPVMAVVIFLNRPSRPRAAITAVVALLFVLHYHGLHYQPGDVPGATTPVWEWLYGFCLLVAGIPYQFLVELVGPVGAGVGAVALTAMVLTVAAGLTRKILRRRATSLDNVSLVFMGYALLLALAAVVVRARLNGWEYVLASRYSNMSAFALIGLMLAWLSLGQRICVERLGVTIRRAGWAFVAALFLFSCFGSVKFLRSVPVRRNSVQTYMIPYTLEPWSLPADGMTSPRALQAAAQMRDRMIDNKKGVFGSRPYRVYRDFPDADGGASVPTLISARVEIRYIESQPEKQLLHLNIRADASEVRQGYLWAVLVDGKKAGWALPVDTLVWPVPAGTNPDDITAYGFSVCYATNHTLQAVLLNKSGVPILRTAESRIGKAGPG